jgi:predicted DCC family thiol-disulfide oxidoreductase YuxK
MTATATTREIEGTPDASPRREIGEGRESPGSQSPPAVVLFYDGICPLCNRLVRWTVRRDRTGGMRFAALQSGTAARILAQFRLARRQADSLVLLVHGGTPAAEMLVRSDAILHVARALGGWWRVAAAAVRVVPRPLRDAVYGIVARTRHRVFGRYPACPTPPADQRHRFLDLE